MSVAEMIGIGGLDSPQEWQQVPLGLLFLTFWGVLVKVLLSPDDGGDAPSPCRPQPQVFGSYFSSLASAPAVAKGPQKLASVAVDSKEVAAMLKTLQAAADRLHKESCAAIVEAIVTADASIAEATRANPYVEPVPEEAPAPAAPEAAPRGGRSKPEAPAPAAPAEELAPAEEEPEALTAGPSKKTKKKKEKAVREAAPAAEAPEEPEPSAEDLLAVVEAAEAAAEAEAEVEVFQEPAKQKKKKNRKKKLEEQADEDEEDEEEAAAEQPPAADSFVPVEAHPEEAEEAEEEQADEAAEEQVDDEEEAAEEEVAAEAEAEEEEEEEDAEAEAEAADAEEEEEEEDAEEEEEDEEAKDEAAEEAAPEEAEEEAAADEAAEEAALEEDDEEEDTEPPPPQPPTEIQKNIMKVKKKIREIEDLEAKQEAGTTLSANQVEKVAKKAGLQTELEDLENTPEPHTIEWKATVVDHMNPLHGVMVKVEGQGADKGPFPLLAAHMDPPVALDDLNSIIAKYPKGADLKVRVLRNGENVTVMSVEKEEKRWKVVKMIAERLEELKKEDKRVTDLLWENCGTWSDEEFTGTTTLVKDFGVKVLTSFGRSVLVRPDDLKGEWRFKDPTSGLARPRKDVVEIGATVQLRLKYVDNHKREEDQNYFGSMIVSK